MSEQTRSVGNNLFFVLRSLHACESILSYITRVTVGVSALARPTGSVIVCCYRTSFLTSPDNDNDRGLMNAFLVDIRRWVARLLSHA